MVAAAAFRMERFDHVAPSLLETNRLRALQRLRCVVAWIRVALDARDLDERGGIVGRADPKDRVVVACDREDVVARLGSLDRAADAGDELVARVARRLRDGEVARLVGRACEHSAVAKVLDRARASEPPHLAAQRVTHDRSRLVRRTVGLWREARCGLREARAQRGHGNVVDRTRGLVAHGALGVAEELREARVAQLAHGEHRGKPQRRHGLRSELAEPRAVVEPRERLHARMTQEDIAVCVLGDHRDDRGMRLARADPPKRHRREGAHAQRVVGAEVHQLSTGFLRTALAEHARSLRADLRVTIIEKRKDERRRLEIAAQRLRLEHARLAAQARGLLPKRPDRVDARKAIARVARHIAEKRGGLAPARSERELRALAHAAVAMRKKRRKLVRVAPRETLAHEARGLGDAWIGDRLLVPHSVELALLP